MELDSLEIEVGDLAEVTTAKNEKEVIPYAEIAEVEAQNVENDQNVAQNANVRNGDQNLKPKKKNILDEVNIVEVQQ